jgi:hypothetical protein
MDFSLSLARSVCVLCCVYVSMPVCVCVWLLLYVSIRQHTSTYSHVCLDACVCVFGSCSLSRSRSLLVTSYATMQNGQVRAMGSSKYGQTGQGNQGNCQVLRLGSRA